eukprot:TRINITY_DN9528_c0_g1_i2.p2 TRINITY_DN9528_c0_g1~~TRINITY_DN9528_c0_g1_i2.p2  ORF type:complete len:147 (+),score=13.10 TRINITY_DN9528_c0_g1_i2:3-443(+)
MALNVATVLQLTCFIASVSSATSTAEPQHSWIFKTNKTIVYSHMSMILALPNSNILAAWQASNLSEGCADQRILLAVTLAIRVHEQQFAKEGFALAKSRWRGNLDSAPRGPGWFWLCSVGACAALRQCHKHCLDVLFSLGFLPRAP